MKPLALALALTLGLATSAAAELRFRWDTLPKRFDQSLVERTITECAQRYLRLPYADHGPIDFVADPRIIEISFEEDYIRTPLGLIAEGAYRPFYQKMSFSIKHGPRIVLILACTHEFRHAYDEFVGLMPFTQLYFQGLRRFHAAHQGLNFHQAAAYYRRTLEGQALYP